MLLDIKSSLVYAQCSTLLLFPAQTHLGVGIWEQQRQEAGFLTGMYVK